MRYTQRRWNKVLSISLIGLLALLAILYSSGIGETSASRPAAPSIKITMVPPNGEGSNSWGTIGGIASGVDFDKCKVVIFARTNTWWVQPYADNPFTQIQDGGKWETDIHLGNEYAALLVKADYKPPATTSILPQIGGNILAISRVPAGR
jgi:hypothetical protein